MTTLNSLYLTSFETLIDEDPCINYSNWSAKFEYTVFAAQSKRFSAKSADLDMLTVCFEVLPYMPVYVIAIRFGEGDSFGQSCGKGEVVWAFKDKQHAEAQMAVLEPQLRDKKAQLVFTDECNNEIRLGNVAHDYFSTFEKLELYTLRVDSFD